MNRIICFVIFFIVTNQAKGQSTSTANAETIAARIKDSLNLTTSQKSQIYTATLQILTEKKEVVKENSYGPVFRVKELAIENKRDSLYQTILTTPQYKIYERKKGVLVSY